MGVTSRWFLMLGGMVLVPSVLQCGGRSERTGERPGGGDAGEPAGGATSGSSGTGPRGGGPTGGAAGTGRGGTGATGGSSGTATGGSGGSDPRSLCRLPAESGSCLAYVPSFWFDAATGVCIPFVYGGCDGNDNRFPSLEACYMACGGQGDRDDAACTGNTNCVAQRLAEPCCSTDVRDFVAVNTRAGFQCLYPELGCHAVCAADCAYLPEDGYIGATCDAGHCIPFDARERGFTSCRVDADCAFTYGMGCCSDDCCSPGFCSGCQSEGCAPGLTPSKLVAIGPTKELLSLICDPGAACTTDDRCEYPTDRRAICDAGKCGIVHIGAE